MSSPCPEGMIKRKRYVKSDGTVVKSACIEATSLSGMKSAVVNAPMIKKMLSKERAAERATADRSPTSCPEGMVRRSAYIRDAYVRSDGTRVSRAVVAADCIEQQGKPKAAPGLYDPKTGERIYIMVGDDSLGKYGYSDLKHKTVAERHAALDRAFEGMNRNWLSLFRMLNYLAVVNQRHVKLHRTLLADRNYIRKKYGKHTGGDEETHIDEFGELDSEAGKKGPYDFMGGAEEEREDEEQPMEGGAKKKSKGKKAMKKGGAEEDEEREEREEEPMDGGAKKKSKGKKAMKKGGAEEDEEREEEPMATGCSTGGAKKKAAKKQPMKKGW